MDKNINVKKKKKMLKKAVSHILKPQELSLEQWQIILRKQIARESGFRIENKGEHPVFSTFTVTNRKTKGVYRVVISGEELGVNYCSCPDFAINTLGTCKHIEYVLRKLRGNRENRQILKQGFIPEYSCITLRYGHERKIAFLLGTKASPALKTIINQYFNKERFLTQRGFEHFDDFIRQANSLPDNIQYHEDAIKFIAGIRDVKSREERIQKIFPGGVNDKNIDKLLKMRLYPFQKEGVLFALNAGRCLLADDMGLGKTVQAIAVSELMAHCFGIEKVLIICPTSLKHQWQKEIEKFSDKKVTVIQKLLPERHSFYKEEGFYKITNYDVIHKDIQAIEEWSPDLIILDEAQRIKNWKTRLARTVKKLNSQYALVLTGTPLENRIEELHSIVQFIDKHHLGPLFRFLDNHQTVDENTGKTIGYRNLNLLGESLKTILIRRKKEMALKQLPERIDKNYFVPMTTEQMNIHEENAALAARIIQKWKKYKFLSEDDKRRLMIALQNMRMVSDDIYLMDQNKMSGNKINELETALTEIFEDKNAKVVIFSQWIKMLELVIAMSDANNWKHVFLHGGVPGDKRGDLIMAFREDPECKIFLSTEAGGVGLNLQNAATVINLDLPWNPAVLEQRIGRVHRLGQKNSVRVINFIAENSIEQGILGLLALKRSMFAGVLDKGENEIFLGGSRFNKFIQTVEKATDNISQKQEIPSDAEIKRINEITEESLQEVPDEVPAEKNEADTASEKPVFNKDVLRGLLDAGSAFLKNLSSQLEDKDGTLKTETQNINFPVSIQKDLSTGRKVLQISSLDDRTMENLSKLAEAFLSMFKPAEK